MIDSAHVPVTATPGAVTTAPGDDQRAGVHALIRNTSAASIYLGNADVTVGNGFELVDLYLDRHAATVGPRTIATLRERLAYATRAYGNVPLRDLERMSGDLAGWRTTLPDHSRYAITSALRQALGAAVRWGCMTRNPAVLAGRNPQPAPRAVRAYSPAELDALAAQFCPEDAALVRSAAATGLRPEEWLALERRDVDRTARILAVRRTVSDGDVVEIGKTSASLAGPALPPSARRPRRPPAPARLAVALPRPLGSVRNLDNWRRRTWAPAVKFSEIATPARIYDLRSTFASDALAAGIPVFTLAKIMGTSVGMIERHYGTLLDGASAGIAGALDALDAGRDRATADGRPDV